MHWEFVIAGYSFAAVLLVGYSLWVLRRGRSLSARVPEEKRRFFG